MVSTLAFAASENQIIPSVKAPATMIANRSDGQRIISRLKLKDAGQRQAVTVAAFATMRRRAALSIRLSTEFVLGYIAPSRTSAAHPRAINIQTDPVCLSALTDLWFHGRYGPPLEARLG